MVHAYSYITLSDQNNAADKDIVSQQDQAISEFAHGNGIAIERTFYEKRMAGTTESREALVEMIANLDQNYPNVRVVIVEKLDRLSIDPMTQAHIILDLQRKRIRLMSVKDDGEIQGDHPVYKLIQQLCAIAEYDGE